MVDGKWNLFVNDDVALSFDIMIGSLISELSCDRGFNLPLRENASVVRCLFAKTKIST